MGFAPADAGAQPLTAGEFAATSRWPRPSARIISHKARFSPGKVIRCTARLFGRAGVTVQPDGADGSRRAKRGVLWSLDASVLSYEWIDLETGALLREGLVAGASGPGALGSTAAYVVPMDGGGSLAIVDLATGRTGRILSSGGTFVVGPASSWDLTNDKGTETLQVARVLGDERSFEIVAIDPWSVLR